jgi:molecular chaperone GrpE (heat shock protein)
MELDLAEEKSVVQEKIAELKKEAIKKTQALGRVYQEVNESFERGRAEQTKTQADKDSKKDVIQSSLPSTEIQEPGVSVT